jgi:hypothetical protein
MAALLADPRWAHAARALVDGCVDLPADEDRVALLCTICDRLGDELYPALLRVLCTIGHHGDHAARAAVARALVHALRTGRLPSGRRSAWGASGPAQYQDTYARTRSLGPLEYLCAWHAQAEAANALAAGAFERSARALLDLVSASAEARALYCEKLLADVDDPLSGALTRQTREALRALATAWAAGAGASEATSRFLQALPAARPTPLAALFAPPSCAAR